MRSPCWELHSSVGTKSVSAMQRMREGMARKKKKYDAVFEGGGVRGIALVGAYSVLEENGFQPVNLPELRQEPSWLLSSPLDTERPISIGCSWSSTSRSSRIALCSEAYGSPVR